jgi:SAM-dependent methyltransferase
MDMDDPRLAELGEFDLVHSAYGLPFAADPGPVIARAAACLRPGGVLLISMAHPLSMGEWLDLDGEPGVFVSDYFSLPPDVRTGPDGSKCRARGWPLGTVSEWISSAGLLIERLLEPAATAGPAPYEGADWREWQERLERIPFAAIWRARKPGADAAKA